MKKILLVDDDIAVTNYLMVFLMQSEIYESTVINDSREIPELLDRENFDAILLDMDMPGLSGTDILRIVKEKKIGAPVIILTGVSDVDLAVKAMKLGAFDYLTKPVEDDDLLEALDNAIKHETLHHSITQLPSKLKKEDLAYAEAFDCLPTIDPVMIRLFHQVEKMAASDLSIFIWGERGTAKEPLARAIHKAGPRRDAPFVHVNAAAQDPERFPADFFGQARDWSGAREERPGFIEQANGGTLFLDEIHHLSLPMQVRLLRVVQTKEYYFESSTKIRNIDVRFIASSNHDLTRKEYKQTFSRDLLYHLMINSIQIPPLRDRRNDIPLMAQYFMEQGAKKAGKEIRKISPEYIDLLKKYDFPGNMQELHDIIATSIVNEENEVITVDSLSPYIHSKLTEPGLDREIVFQPRSLAEVEREHVAGMIEHYDGDWEKAARKLGVPIIRMETILNGGES